MPVEVRTGVALGCAALLMYAIASKLSAGAELPACGAVLGSVILSPYRSAGVPAFMPGLAVAGDGENPVGACGAFACAMALENYKAFAVASGGMILSAS